MMTASRNRTLPLAVGLAAATTFVTYIFLTRQGALRLRIQPPQPAITLTQVAVPATDVAPLQPLHASMFATRSLPSRSVPPDAVTLPAEMEGKVSLAGLTAGQPVLRSAVAARSAQLGLAFTVHPPRRAVTVVLDPEIGVNGFPKVGNHVDVLATFNPTPDQKEPAWITATVLQDIEVLAMGADVQPAPAPSGSGKAAGATPGSEPKIAPTVTLAVLPDEAERLVLAERRGKLHLALRAVGDTSRVKMPGVEEAELSGAPIKRSPTAKPVAPRPAVERAPRAKPAPRKPAAVPAPHVVVVRGSQSAVVTIARPGLERAAAPLAPLTTTCPAPIAATAPTEPNTTGTGVPPAGSAALASVSTPAQPIREGGLR